VGNPPPPPEFLGSRVKRVAHFDNYFVTSGAGRELRRPRPIERRRASCIKHGGRHVCGPGGSVWCGGEGAGCQCGQACACAPRVCSCSAVAVHGACGPVMTCVPRERPNLQHANGAAGLTGARGCGGQRFAVLCGLGLVSAASAFAPAPVAAPRLRGKLHRATHPLACPPRRGHCLSLSTAAA